MTVSSEKTRSILSIEKSLKSDLEEIAKNQNRSLNNLIITILKDYVSSTQNK